MPKYRITDPQTGRTVTVSGEKPPTQQDAEGIFSQAGLRQTAQPVAQTAKPGFFENLASVVLPASTNVARQIGATTAFRGGDQKAYEQSLDQAQRMNQRLTQALKTETDPAKRELLLRAARDSGANISDIAVLTAQGQQNAIGMTDQQARRGNIENAARSGFAAGTELASWLVPPAQGARATSATGRIGQAAIQGAKVGTLTGTSNALLNADSAKGAAIDLGVGAVGGAVTSGAAQGVLEAGAVAANYMRSGVKALREKGLEAYASTFKESRASQDIIERLGGPNKTAEKFIEYKIPKTKSGVSKELEKMNDLYDKKVDAALKNVGENTNSTVDFEKILESAKKAAKKRFRLPGTEQRELEEALSMIDGFSNYEKSMKPLSANNLRKQLDRSYSGKNPLQVRDGEKWTNDFLANQLRESVQNAAPITKPFFRRYSLLKSAEQIFYKEPKVGFNELLGATVAGSLGGTNLAGGLVGAAGARVAKSPGALRGLAGLLSKAMPTSATPLPIPGNTAPRVLAPQVKPQVVVNPALSSLQRMIDKERNAKQEKKALP